MNVSTNFSDVVINPKPVSSPLWIAIQVGLWSCLTVLTVTGNVVILMCICHGAKRLESSTYSFYASLATSDCLVGMFCAPLLMFSTMYQDWILGNEVCHAHAVLLSISLNASIATLCLISMDRLNAVKRPFKYRGYETHTQKWTKHLLCVAWLHAIFWGAAPLLGWGEIIQDSVTFSCKPNWSARGISNKSYSLSLALFAFAVPVAAMIIMYFMIYHYSRKCSQWMKTHEGQTDKRMEKVRLMRERAVFRTVMVIIGVFTASWAVYTLITMSKLFIAKTPPNWLIQLGLIFALTGSCTNPFIYAIRDKRLVKEFFRLPFIRTCFCMRKRPSYTGSCNPLEARKLSHTYGTNVINSRKEDSNKLQSQSKEIMSIITEADSEIHIELDINVGEKTKLSIRKDLTKSLLDDMEETEL